MSLTGGTNVVKKIERKVLYPKLNPIISEGKSAITAEKAKELLGWEEESEKNPLDNFLFTHNGKKIRLNNDMGNRDIKWDWVDQFAQDVLTRDWAGPTTMPGETINGEAILITRMGQVAQGQKRLLAIILAKEEWEKKGSRWKTNWKTEPVLETLIVYGISDDPRVIQTLDNTQPRTLADVYQTTGIFTGTATRKEKSLAAKSLAAATNLLWERLVTRETALDKCQTHSASQRFLANHKRLLQCLENIYKLNQDRVLSLMQLSPGHCSTVLYLMGASKTNFDDYHSVIIPTEKKVNWDNWDRANKFWADLAETKSKLNKVISSALGKLENPLIPGQPPTTLGGRLSEKICIIAHAWELYLARKEITEEAITPAYATVDGRLILVDAINFGGIDLGSRQKEKEEEPTPEELKSRIEKERAKKTDAEKTS